MPAPGSTVTTTIRSGPPTPTVPAAGTMFLAYPVGFGPTEWTPVRSVAEAQATYGTSTLAATGILGTLAGFFEHGGELAYVKRLVGPDAAAAVRGLDDADADLSMSLHARTAGAWGNALNVAVAAGSVSGFALTVTHDDALFQPVTIDNLATPAAAIAAIAAHPVLSRFVYGTLGDETAGVPAVLAAAPFISGDDDIAGIGPLDGNPPAELGAGVIVGPTTAGFAGSTPADLAAALDLANEGRRLVFLATPASVEYLVAGAPALAEDIAAIATNAYQAALDEGLDPNAEAITVTIDRLSGVGVFWPVVGVGESGRFVGLSSPCGAIAGLRARAHATEGPHRAPAGEAGILDGLTAALYAPVDETAAAAGDAAGANAIRTIGDTARLYGYKPISLTLADGWNASDIAAIGALEAQRWPLLTARDIVNVAASEADAIAERYVMRPIDPRGHVFADLRRDLLGLGERLASAGSLYARIDRVTRATVDPGYAVDTGPNVNTEETIAAGRILGVLSIRPTPSAPFVDITVAKVALTSAI